MDKSDKRALAWGLGTVATVVTIAGVGSYRANQQGTAVAEGPVSEPIVRTEPVQKPAFDLYRQGEVFHNDATFMIGNMRPTMTPEVRADTWGEIADAQERALDAYTDAIRADPNSSFAMLAQTRIDNFYIDPVFQEAKAGDIIHAGRYSFEVRKKRTRLRNGSAAITLNLYIDGELAGEGYLETSPEKWIVREVVDHLTK